MRDSIDAPILDEGGRCLLCNQPVLEPRRYPLDARQAPAHSAADTAQSDYDVCKNCGKAIFFGRLTSGLWGHSFTADAKNCDSPEPKYHESSPGLNKTPDVEANEPKPELAPDASDNDLPGSNPGSGRGSSDNRQQGAGIGGVAPPQPSSVDVGDIAWHQCEASRTFIVGGDEPVVLPCYFVKGHAGTHSFDPDAQFFHLASDRSYDENDLASSFEAGWNKGYSRALEDRLAPGGGDTP